MPVILKEQLAAALKRVIVTERLHAGQRAVETGWPQEFSMAQVSVREAINLLITERFLVQDAGRGARVVNYRVRRSIEAHHNGQRSRGRKG